MKTYTTTQMIEKLDIGQEAEMVQPVGDVFVKRSDLGIIVTKDAFSQKNSWSHLPMTPTVLRGEWIIHQKPITYQQAIIHLCNGKSVRCKVNGNEGTVYDSMEDLVSFDEILYGVWYMEE